MSGRLVLFCSITFYISGTFGLTTIIPDDISQNASSASVNHLSVMTYNIMQPVIGYWDQKHRILRLIPSLEQLDLPDVIVFTGVIRSSAHAVIKAWKVYPYKTDVVGRMCNLKSWNSTTGKCSSRIIVSNGGVIIISKYPVLTEHQYIFSTYAHNTIDRRRNKGAIFVSVEKEGKTYHVVGTQLQRNDLRRRFHPSNLETHNIRVLQCEEIMNWLSRFQLLPSEPLIFAGDLIDSYIKETDYVLELFRTLHVFDTVYKPIMIGSYSYGSNALTKLSVNWYESQIYNDNVDYILLSKDHAGYVSSDMIAIPLKDNKKHYWRHLKGTWAFGYHTGYYRDLSDHYPVVSVISY